MSRINDYIGFLTTRRIDVRDLTKIVNAIENAMSIGGGTVTVIVVGKEITEIDTLLKDRNVAIKTEEVKETEE
jgi:hypothetical protein